MRHYITIPDIHGEIDKLIITLKKCNDFLLYNNIEDVQWVFLGDLIDRGNNNKEVIEKVSEYVYNRNAILCLGNHDDFLIGTAEGDLWSGNCWQANGGFKTCVELWGKKFDEYFNPLFHPKEYREIILNSFEYDFLKKNAVRFYETDSIYFSHAPQSNLDSINDTTLIWGHDSDYTHSNDDRIFKTPNNKRLSIHGHFHRLSDGINFPRIHNYVHGGIKKTVILADSGCGCADFGELHSVILKENGKYPEIVAIL